MQTGAFLFINLLYEPTKAIPTLEEVVVTDTPYWKNPFDSLQIKIPGMKKFSEATECLDDPNKMCVPWIGEYISGIYKYAIGIVGILAAVVLMIGGIIWLLAGGNATRVGEAKAWIGASLTGLVIALCSYMILYQINPSLTQFGPIKVTDVYEDEDEDEKKECSWRAVGTKSSGNDCSVLNLRNGNDSDCKGQNPTARSDDGLFKCCCPRFGGQWAYDPGIETQLGDASSELNSLLNCLRSNLPVGAGKITSISDSNHIGKLTDCDITNCPNNCQHKCQSCHYGGGTGINKSYAVDIKGNTSDIYSAIDACSSYVKYKEDEGSHIHISTRSCPNN